MVSTSDNSSKDGNPFVVVKDLKKSFSLTGNRRLAVVDVPSFSLGTGQQLAIFGGSGSGKSTFLNLMAGILKTDSFAASPRKQMKRKRRIEAKSEAAAAGARFAVVGRLISQHYFAR